MQRETWGNNDCIIVQGQQSNTRTGYMTADKDNAGMEKEDSTFPLGQRRDYFQNNEQPTSDLSYASANLCQNALGSDPNVQFLLITNSGYTGAFFPLSSVKYALLKQCLWM